MKTKLVIVGSLVCGVLVAVSGCKKQEAPTALEPPKSSEKTTSEPAKAIDAVEKTAKQVTDQATTQAATQATATANAAEQQAQGLIDRAKAYVADQKYQDALGSLSQLANIKLTADQQKLVADLKAQIQSALAKATAKDPASALGGALGGKK